MTHRHCWYGVGGTHDGFHVAEGGLGEGRRADGLEPGAGIGVACKHTELLAGLCQAGEVPSERQLALVANHRDALVGG